MTAISKTTAEPVFGQIGTVQNGRQLLLQGKREARQQWRFNCAIHNLLKLYRTRSGRAQIASGGRRNRAGSLAAHLQHAIANYLATAVPLAVTAPGS